MRGQLRIGSALSWAGAFLLAALGWAAYLVWPSDLSWWLAPLLVAPLVLLIVWRGAVSGHEGGNSGSDGPWGPPDHRDGGGF